MAKKQLTHRNKSNNNQDVAVPGKEIIFGDEANISVDVLTLDPVTTVDGDVWLKSSPIAHVATQIGADIYRIDANGAQQTATSTAPSKRFVVADSTAGDVTITLPTVAGNEGLTFVVIKKVAGNNVYLEATGAETLNGDATATAVTLTTAYESTRVVCDGVEWFTW